MKILAINSSPRGEGQSNTELMLDHLVEGMRHAGAQVEVVHLREKKIRNCMGCYTCWTKTPGNCVHQDDMTRELLPKWLESDLVVYATPVYHYHINAAISKTFIERTLPILEPFIGQCQGRSFHPLRYQNLPQAAVLSVCGFVELEVFDMLSLYMKNLFRKVLVAELYRPAAELLNQPFYRKKAREILEATVQAGRELASQMAVSPQTLERVQQPITDFQQTAQIANLFWKTCIQEGITPKEFMERKLVPRPDSIESFIVIMQGGFNPRSVPELEAVIHFTFAGEQRGDCHFIIRQGNIEGVKGVHSHPDLIIETPFQVWCDIMSGKVDGQQGFMQGQYRASGDFSLLMRFKEMFSGSE